MERRKAIKNISLGFGVTVSSASLMTFLSGCKTEAKSAVSTYQAMSDAQAALVENIMDVILPTTDTPGAKDLGLINQIDLTLSKFYGKEDLEKAQRTLGALSTRIEKKIGGSLDQFDRDAAEQYVTDYYQDLKNGGQEKIDTIRDIAEAERTDAQTADLLAHNAVREIKSWAISNYFRHETIGEKYLTYEPVPGPYQGCVPLSEVENSSSL